MHKCKNQSVGNVYHLQQWVDNFFPYSQEQLGFDQPATIVFQSDEDNASRMLGKTAHYDPENLEVVLYVDNRHPKDIMRSLSHELVHHAQNCRGDFDGGCDKEGWSGVCVKNTEIGYAQRDPHLRKMEEEAYTKGNLIFRDFEDLIKTGKINIEIDFSDSGEPKMSLKELRSVNFNTHIMKKWGFLNESKEEATESDETDTEPLAEDTEGEETYHYAEDEGSDRKREGRLEAHLDAIEHHLHSLRGDMASDEDHERRHERGTDFREGQKEDLEEGGVAYRHDDRRKKRSKWGKDPQAFTPGGARRQKKSEEFLAREAEGQDEDVTEGRKISAVVARALTERILKRIREEIK